MNSNFGICEIGSYNLIYIEKNEVELRINEPLPKFCRVNLENLTLNMHIAMMAIENSFVFSQILEACTTSQLSDSAITTTIHAEISKVLCFVKVASSRTIHTVVSRISNMNRDKPFFRSKQVFSLRWGTVVRLRADPQRAKTTSKRTIPQNPKCVPSLFMENSEERKPSQSGRSSPRGKIYSKRIFRDHCLQLT